MKYLISGHNGQLARAFIKRLSAMNADCLSPDKAEFDITDESKVARICKAFRPDVIINCAAYNLVDRAEQEPDTALKINGTGPQLLARVSAQYKAKLVHFSTDYVFDGLKQGGLYIENDQPNPINQYGRSKLYGEDAVRKETDNFLIFRSSWVFGEGTQNFIHKLLSWAEDNQYLRISCNEFSVPTYTYTIADVTLKALKNGLTGIYHLTNSGYCSRHEWARLIFKHLGITKFIQPVTMESFGLSALRPGFSAMSNTRLSNAIELNIPEWDEAVLAFLKEFHNA